MDAWAQLHFDGVTQRQAERLAEAAVERLALARAAATPTPPAKAGPARPRTPAATREERARPAGSGRVAACVDCPAGQPA